MRVLKKFIMILLCGIAGIENSTLDKSASYIKSWLNVLKNATSFINSASQQAQKAVDYIQGISFKN
ncbi:hypothetical protein KHA94_10310 [Bacillus sp. FJAT-49705]|uniref:Polyvalent protein metallopeptidase domain-containing protein n=1 Tax=Cytobacillus citreus TaxID=2833586 RepID=A0ABS5NT05_9BACI|nr:hypothetical protein [Cytobacillus citreus]MBS4190574.1 hypothetical protein [Cytobacillus citreus]